MFKFSFEDKTHGDDAEPTKIEMSFDSDITWPEVMESFVQFLRGAGYYLPAYVRPTLLDEDGKDLRAKQDAFWDAWAKGEEEAGE
jgi:hypothetical protein